MYMNFLVAERNEIKRSFVAAVMIGTLVLLTYFVSEPVVSYGQVSDTDQFIVTQEITTEIAFTATAADITMSPTIAGVTGGTANGSTQVVVTTNNSAGYSMTIDFASSSYGVAAMNRNGGSGYISDYTPAVAGTPDFSFAAEAYSQLAYTVSASTTGDLDQTFRNNGSACNNNSGGDTAASCWYGPSTSAEQIVQTAAATAASGATTTVHFRVNVPSSPSPVVPAGFYTATATLTATTN